MSSLSLTAANNSSLDNIEQHQKLATTKSQNDLIFVGSIGNINGSNETEDRQDLQRDKNDNETNKKKREVYRYKTDWLISSIAWSNEAGESFQLALSSFIEDYSNRITLISLEKDQYDGEIECLHTFEHPYPATKVLWTPKPIGSKIPQLLATTADYLRLWRVIESPYPTGRTAIGRNNDPPNIECDSTTNIGGRKCTEVKLECLLNPNQGSKLCAPLTSFDWNDIDPTIIVTSSVDTTCAIWDIEVGKEIGERSTPTSEKITCNARSQIVAHNHEVYDVSFSRSGSGRDIFVSAGGDGSVRLFDLRRLSTSTILYETEDSLMNNKLRPDSGSSSSSISDNSNGKALVRVCCSKQNPNYVSTFALNSKDIILLDIRSPGRPIAVLSSHTANLNGMSWAPHSAHHICSASDDCQALIWDLSKLPNSPVEEPLLAYRSNGKINLISWSAAHSDWIAIGFQNYLELLRV